MKKRLVLFLICCLALVPGIARAGNAASIPAVRSRVVTDAYSLIAEVNALRAANGLAAYAPNATLMSVAQQHAEYMAATGTVTHYNADGSRSWQRALAAGYPLAGDLSLGGFFSENIMAGDNLSVQEAVTAWQGDAPHLHTMLSADLQEIGAGVALVGDYVYYTIDCARPTPGGQPQAYTPPAPAAGTTPGAGSAPLANTIVPSTPNGEGKIIHTVRPGETLWLIAISYGVKIAEIRQWNGLAEAQAIFPGDKLLIKASAVPTQAAVTLTVAPTVTAWASPVVTLTLVPTWTPQPLAVPPPAAAPLAAAASNSSKMVLAAIVGAALVLAAVFVRAARRK
jgi:uncharacterized protein YkwD/LysM repeat protein